MAGSRIYWNQTNKQWRWQTKSAHIKSVSIIPIQFSVQFSESLYSLFGSRFFLLFCLCSIEWWMAQYRQYIRYFYFKFIYFLLIAHTLLIVNSMLLSSVSRCQYDLRSTQLIFFFRSFLSISGDHELMFLMSLFRNAFKLNDVFYPWKAFV